ncbi:MAG: hypothetical protein ACR2MK_04520 [Solirubrobacteraceae bacterium]
MTPTVQRDPVAICSECGRERPCHAARSAAPLCDTCRGRRYVKPIAVCSVCGREGWCRGAKTTTPVCQNCLAKRRPKWVAPTRVCVICKRERPCVHADTPAPMCRSCANHHPSRHEPCACCGELRHVTARSTAGPECGTCRTRRMRSTVLCAACERTARPSAGHAGVCERCAGEHVGQICTQCGAEEQNYSVGRCAGCSLKARIAQLAQAGDPAAVTALSGYLAALAGSPKPLTTLNWMVSGANDSRGFRILRQLINGELPLTHEALDTLDRATADHLRAQFVLHGALPERSERAAGLALLIDSELLRVPEGPDRLHLRAFATWKVHHDLARKERRGEASRHADMRPRATVRVAADLLVWLTEHDLTLATLEQEHLDWWLANGTGHRRHARAFIAWTVKHKITGRLTVTAPATRQHADPLDPDRRRALLRTLLTDQQLDLRDRFAGVLVVVFSQRISQLVLLTIDDVHEHDRQVHLAIGRDPLLLPEPIATLTRQLKHQTDSRWLIHGGRNGNHLSEVYMRERLTRLGIKALPARTAANHELASRLPSAILADLLGFADNTTERWAKLAAGDWTRYAAHRAATTTPTDTARSAADPHSPVALRAPAS